MKNTGSEYTATEIGNIFNLLPENLFPIAVFAVRWKHFFPPLIAFLGIVNFY